MDVESLTCAPDVFEFDREQGMGDKGLFRCGGENSCGCELG